MVEYCDFSYLRSGVIFILILRHYNIHSHFALTPIGILNIYMHAVLITMIYKEHIIGWATNFHSSVCDFSCLLKNIYIQYNLTMILL